MKCLQCHSDEMELQLITSTSKTFRCINCGATRRRYKKPKAESINVTQTNNNKGHDFSEYKPLLNGYLVFRVICFIVGTFICITTLLIILTFI